MRLLENDLDSKKNIFSYNELLPFWGLFNLKIKRIVLIGYKSILKSFVKMT